MICTERKSLPEYHCIQHTGDNIEEIDKFFAMYYRKEMVIQPLEGGLLEIIELVLEYNEWFAGPRHLVEKSQYIVVNGEHRLEILDEEQFNGKYKIYEGR